MPQLQNILTSSDYVPCSGTGTIYANGRYRDVHVYGYFKRYFWWFIVHQDYFADETDAVTVSEASTGYMLQNETYTDVEAALSWAVPFIDKKKLYFATRVNHLLVQTRVNLLKRNLSLMTPAIGLLL